MSRCEKFRADVAASLYESLEPDAQARLDSHLASCASCRAEAEALRALVAQLPRETTEFTGDLLPALREELRKPPRRFDWRIWAPLGVAALLVIGVFTGLQPNGTQEQTPIEHVSTALVSDPDTIAREIEARALELASSGDFNGARALLQRFLTHEMASGGILLEALGDIEFDHGQRYAQAFDAYDRIRREYPNHWTETPAEVKDRYDLLTEVRPDAFEPLLRLDAADSFESYETVLARYPRHELVASRAVAKMEALVAGEADAADANTRVATLEQIRARCSEPLAVAQLSISLGNLYWKELKDPVRARALYEEATRASDVTLAQRAEASLSALDEAARQ